jgi:signal transduction histidine kinase
MGVGTVSLKVDAMSLRLRLIVCGLVVALISIVGSMVIFLDVKKMVKTQEMLAFKTHIFERQERARELIHSAQAIFYQQQAAYTKDIDSMVDQIMELEEIVARIPGVYARNYDAPFCLSCHPEGYGKVEYLGRLFLNLQKLIQRYKEDVSILITAGDSKSRFVQHATTKLHGEEIIKSIDSANRATSMMVGQLLAWNIQLHNRSRLFIGSTIATMTIVLLIVISYVVYLLYRSFSALLQRTESISRGDYSLRLPVPKRKDEIGEFISRFNQMAEKLEVRDRQIQEKTVELEELNGQLHDVNDQLREMNKNLEEAVLERTMKLEESMEELQATTASLQNANRELIRANEVKSNFLAIISHELRTPLMVIQGYLSLLLDGAFQDDSKKATEALNSSLRECEGLGGMINKMIALSQTDGKSMPLKLEPVAFDQLLGEVALQFREHLEQKRFRLINGCDPNMAPLVCDRERLQQVLSNLMSNAVKFSPKGGQIELGCEEREEDFLIFCRDHGIGIPLEEREKIFEKFYQVDSSDARKFDGAGIGLSLVKEIMLLHGGKVWVESEPGHGTTFFLSLPKKDQFQRDLFQSS